MASTHKKLATPTFRLRLQSTRLISSRLVAFVGMSSVRRAVNVVAHPDRFCRPAVGRSNRCRESVLPELATRRWQTRRLRKILMAIVTTATARMDDLKLWPAVAAGMKHQRVRRTHLLRSEQEPSTTSKETDRHPTFCSMSPVWTALDVPTISHEHCAAYLARETFRWCLLLVSPSWILTLKLQH